MTARQRGRAQPPGRVRSGGGRTPPNGERGYLASRRGVRTGPPGRKLGKANIGASRRAALRVALSELSAEARRRPADYFTACVAVVLVLLAAELEGLLEA